MLGRIRGRGDLHRVAQHKDAAGLHGAPVIRLAQRHGTYLVVGRGDLHLQGVVLAQLPVGGGNADAVDTLDLEAGMLLIHGDGHAAVAVPFLVVTLYPIATHRQIDSIGAVGCRHVRQQVPVALHASGIGVDLEGRHLRAVHAAECHAQAARLRHIGLHRGVHDNRGIAVIRTYCHQIFPIILVSYLKGHFSLFISDSVLDLCACTSRRIDPCQLDALQRLGRRLQFGGGLIAQAVPTIGNAGNRSGKIFPSLCRLRHTDPSVGIQCLRILINEEIQHIAIVDTGRSNLCTIIAVIILRSIIGRTLIDRKAVI